MKLFAIIFITTIMFTLPVLAQEISEKQWGEQYNQAAKQFTDKNYEEVIRLLKALPDRYQVKLKYDLLGRAYFASEKYDLAIRALSKNLPEAKTLLLVAQARYKLRQPDKALELMKYVTAIEAENKQYKKFYHQLLVAYGERDVKKQFLQEEAKKSLLPYPWLMQLVKLYVEDGQTVEAYALAASGMVLYQDEQLLLKTAADLAMQLEKYDVAESMYLKLNPKPKMNLNLLNSYLLQGKYQKLGAALKQISEQDRLKHPQLTRMYMLYLREQKDWDGFAASLEKLHKTNHLKAWMFGALIQEDFNAQANPDRLVKTIAQYHQHFAVRKDFLKIQISTMLKQPKFNDELDAAMAFYIKSFGLDEFIERAVLLMHNQG